MALNGQYCVDVPLRNYSLTHSLYLLCNAFLATKLIKILTIKMLFIVKKTFNGYYCSSVFCMWVFVLVHRLISLLTFVLQKRRDMVVAVNPGDMALPVIHGQALPAARHWVSRVPTAPAAHQTPPTPSQTDCYHLDTTALGRPAIVHWLTPFTRLQ